jgi:hypothetical protein
MEISHIGHTTVYTPSRNIHLNNVIYVPEATKKILFLVRLAEDNCVFVEFHPPPWVSFVSWISERRIYFLKEDVVGGFI